MGMLFWWAEVLPSLGTLPLVLALNSLYLPQPALFHQRAGIGLRNCLLFCIRYFWRVMGAGLLQMACWAVLVLLAPWTLLLLPVTGVWYIWGAVHIPAGAFHMSERSFSAR